MPHQIEPEIFIRGTVKDGKFNSYKPQSEQKWLSSMEGKEIIRIYRETVPDTTPNQHAYLRGVVIRMVCMKSDRFDGWEEDDIYDYFADMYLSLKVIRTMNGKSVVVNKRLSMATCGMPRSTEFIRRVLQDLAEYKECPLIPPPPEDVIYHKYSNKDRTNGKKEKDSTKKE
jgi:hypothetical protein